jgi:hypothetical protein
LVTVRTGLLLLPSNAIAEAGDSDGRTFKVASIQDSDLPADVVFGHLGGTCSAYKAAARGCH